MLRCQNTLLVRRRPRSRVPGPQCSRATASVNTECSPALPGDFPELARLPLRRRPEGSPRPSCWRRPVRRLRRHQAQRLQFQIPDAMRFFHSQRWFLYTLAELEHDSYRNEPAIRKILKQPKGLQRHRCEDRRNCHAHNEHGVSAGEPEGRRRRRKFWSRCQRRTHSWLPAEPYWIGPHKWPRSFCYRTYCWPSAPAFH